MAPTFAKGIDAEALRNRRPWAASLPTRFVVFMCTLGVTLALAAAPASAVTAGHIFDMNIGGPGTGAGQFGGGPFYGYQAGVAVDETTGDIYVADTGNKRVQKFGPTGNFILAWGYGVEDGSNEFQVCIAPGPCQQGLSGFAPGQFVNPDGIAVDNSGGPNQGRVYVADSAEYSYSSGRNEILKFDSEGTYLGVIDGAASPGGPFEHLSRGVSVDGLGFVWAADFDRVMRFSNQTGNAYVGGSEWPVRPLGEVSRLAAVSDGSAVYVIHPYGSGLTRYVADGSESRPAGEDARVVAVNHLTNHFYIGHSTYNSTRLQEYDGDPAEPKPVGLAFAVNEFPVGQLALAVNSITDTVYALGSTHGGISIYKPRRVPETVTSPATEVLHTTATLNGHTTPDPDEGGPVSDCYFEWGLSKGYEHETPCDPGTPIGASTDVSAELAAVLQEGTYHYRLVAANSVDTEYGEDRTFTTHAVLETNTGEASNRTASSATLNGEFNPDGLQTEYFFEWDKGKNNGKYEHATPVADGGSGSGLTSVSEELQGLEDYTLYHYRIATTNGLGTSHGPDRTFRTTPPDAPTVSESAAGNVSTSGAHLSAVVTPHFGEAIYGFEYGEMPSYGAQTFGGELLPADDQSHQVGAQVEGLIPGRTYHFRAIAINFGGIAYGPDLTFTTLDVPNVLTTSVSSITAQSAMLGALVSPSLSESTVRFEYGPSDSYGSQTQSIAIGAGAGAQQVAARVAGLAAQTRYHFRTIATNAIGTATGPDQTFTTSAAETIHVDSPAKKCKRGFVKRGGKCVRKAKKHAKRRKGGRQ